MTFIMEINQSLFPVRIQDREEGEEKRIASFGGWWLKFFLKLKILYAQIQDFGWEVRASDPKINGFAVCSRGSRLLAIATWGLHLKWQIQPCELGGGLAQIFFPVSFSRSGFGILTEGEGCCQDWKLSCLCAHGRGQQPPPQKPRQVQRVETQNRNPENSWILKSLCQNAQMWNCGHGLGGEGQTLKIASSVSGNPNSFFSRKVIK